MVPAILNESGEELEGPSEGYLVPFLIASSSSSLVAFAVVVVIVVVLIVSTCSNQVFKQPWPGIMRTVYGNHQRFETTYFKKFSGYYVTGDGETERRHLSAGSGVFFTTSIQLLIVGFGFVCPAGCRRDKDGYYWITGRIDDMLNVSGMSSQSFQQVAAVLLSPPEGGAAANVSSALIQSFYCGVVGFN